MNVVARMLLMIMMLFVRSVVVTVCVLVESFTRIANVKAKARRVIKIQLLSFVFVCSTR